MNHSHRILTAFAGFLAATALGHQPIISDGTATDPDSAIVLDDPQVSRVVYHAVEDPTSQLWVAFDVDLPQVLRIQLGVPFIERLRSYRPTLVLIGPGLPEPTLAGLAADGGQLVYDTRAFHQPEEFYEPFSGTTSWIWVEEDVELPEAGRYYLVAFDPAATEGGKLWVATGVREEFSPEDFASLADLLPQVSDFHETEPGGVLACFFMPAVGGLAMWSLLRRRD